MKTLKSVIYPMIMLFGLGISQTVLAANSAPQFSLDGDNGTVNLADFKGKVVYLDFWASWCPPCRKSFPWMNAMERRYGDQGLAIVAVNLDKDRKLAEKFLHDLPASFTIAYDPEGKVADSYEVEGMPSSYIIDRDGQISAVHLGFRQDDIRQLENTLKKVLNR
jgi:cytochrome c biogenesis protein CcmG/thiol:disulfide interchange protein DsbE